MEKLGCFEELENELTLEFALKAQELGHGRITDSGDFIAEYPYYGAQWCRTMIYPIVK